MMSLLYLGTEPFTFIAIPIPFKGEEHFLLQDSYQIQVVLYIFVRIFFLIILLKLKVPRHAWR